RLRRRLPRGFDLRPAVRRWCVLLQAPRVTHVHSCDHLGDMETTNALQLRRTLGKVLRKLERDGKPILVEKGRKPKAVLISLRDYNERFVNAIAADEREALVSPRTATPRGGVWLTFDRAVHQRVGR